MELALYKLIMTPDPEDADLSYVSELGWENNESFCVWVSYHWIKEFVDELKAIFGYGLFDDGGFVARIQGDDVCIDLSEVLEGYLDLDLDLETVFPKDKFKH